MKNHYIIYLKEGEEIIDFFMVKNIAVKIGSNRKKYLDLMLSDSTGEISAKKWDIDDAEAEAFEKIEIGQIVKIKSTVTEWKGLKQLRVTRIRAAVVTDGIRKRDFFKTAPEESEDMYNYIIDRINSFKDEELKKLCLSIYEENRDKLMYYPAAMTNHHAEYGGLLYHTKRMMMLGEKVCEVYTNLSKELLLAGVALHDIEKINEIVSDENGISPGYSFEGNLLGHIVQGTRVVHNRCMELGISKEKMIMLEHMILSHHYEPEFGSPKKPLFPEAEMLHYLDIIDARMFDMEDALRGVKPGEFGEKVWVLDNRRLYKKTF